MLSFYVPFRIMGLDAAVWGPHFWFFLHTIALNYPKYPNDVSKKRFYDLIQGFDLFIPVEKHAKQFRDLLNEYPISPYLDNRDSFIRWVHFVHNKINEKLEKPKITLAEFYITYYDEYKSKEQKYGEYYKLKEKAIYGGSVLVLLGIIYWLYDK